MLSMTAFEQMDAFSGSAECPSSTALAVGAGVLLLYAIVSVLARYLDGPEEYWAQGGSAVGALLAEKNKEASDSAEPPAKRQRRESEEMIWREDGGKSVRVPMVYPSSASVAKRARTDITMADVASHNSRDDCWICVEGRAYDVTKYIEHHPGGWLPIVNLAGKDVTDAFANYHPAFVYEKQLPHYYIGDIQDYKVSEFVKEHRSLRQVLLSRGLFETRPSFYLWQAIWFTALFVAALYFSVCGSSFSRQLLGGALMALFWQQQAFWGHDTGHNAVTHDRKLDVKWGILLGNTSGGISLGWWKRSHNVHHVVCNSIENDPDIQHLPIFAIVPGIFGHWWSSYHEKYMDTDFVARMLCSYQHFLYYPVMAFARFNLYAQGWLLLLAHPKKESPDWNLEVYSLIGFASWYLTMLATCFASWKHVLAYVVLSHALAGILNLQITLSHFAEDTYHGQAYNDDSDEWFRMQVKTTLNVDCPTWMDWFHGGLQFQVEHHLYPRLPRHNLRECRTLVKALCKKHDIKYKELGFFSGQYRVFERLKATAAEARKLTKGDGGFYRSALYEGLMAQG